MAECYLINSKSSKADSVTYTWQNTAVAADEYIFDITLPDYMNEDGAECDVVMKFVGTSDSSTYMAIYLDNDVDGSYIGGISSTGSSVKYSGRRISIGFCKSTKGFNTYHFTIRNMFETLYVEGTSTSIDGTTSSNPTKITSHYVIQHANTTGAHSIQIYPHVAVADTGSAIITIREVKR